MMCILRKPCSASSNLLQHVLAASLARRSSTSSAIAGSQANSSSPIPFLPLFNYSNALESSSPGIDGGAELRSEEIAAAVGDWFRLGADAISPFDRVYAALSSADDASVDSALAALRLPLSETFVLSTLRHRPHPSFYSAANPEDGSFDGLLLRRLKFFDWSGRQFPYRHSRATYHEVFRLLSRASLVKVVLNWLDLFSASAPDLRRDPFLSGSSFGSVAVLKAGPHPRFHETLIVGYAVAGKPELALQLLARMRFQGLDPDSFSYHVLLNSLVEASIYDFAESLISQISCRGLAGPVTSCIKVKSLCRQGLLQDAESYLREVASNPAAGRLVAGHMVGTLVHALCKKGKFEAAGRIVDEFGSAGAYGVWVGNLLGAGKLDAALEFLECKKVNEDYIPETFHYNKLVFCLLKDNRLEEVYNVLVEMIEEGIAPNRVTMNAALCFFCKAGMVDVAIILYNSRQELGINLNARVYDHLITAICQGGSIDGVYQVLEECMQQGYFPGKKVFHILANLLCREGKLDEMRKLLDGALQQKKSKPLSVVFARYISALCKAGEVEEAALVPQLVGGEDAVLLGRYKSAYVNLIRACIMLRRVDMLPQLIIEMQDRGHIPSRSLYRSLVCCLCEMGQFDEVIKLLKKQLERKELDIKTCYNYFIDGAAHSKKPDMARELYSRMESSGVPLTIDTNILMLQGYLKSEHIGNALKFFYHLREKGEPSTKLYNVLITGLCDAGMPGDAVRFWEEMREKGLIPSLQCYEELVLTLSSAKYYRTVVKILRDFKETGRPVSSFLCNVLLSHTLRSPELLQAWIHSKEGVSSGEIHAKTEGSGELMIGHLIAAFSGGIRLKENLDKLEEVVESFFPADIYTYNMLLRGFIMAGRMDYACSLFDRMPKKGFEPNRWSFDIIVHGFCKQRQRKEAERWMEAMYQNGFHPTWYTMRLYNNIA